MTKPELGTKRLCTHCGAKFYDLHHVPIACPNCDTVFEVGQVPSRWRAEAARAPVREAGAAAAEALEPQFVSPEDADVQAEGEQKPGDASEAEDEVEPDDERLDDAAFIEESDQGATDVTEIIGGDTKIENGN
jgi:uncharacterized protein (TIGR02300 family)